MQVAAFQADAHVLGRAGTYRSDVDPGARRPLPSIAQSFWSVTLLPSAQPLILGIAWTLRHEVTFYLIFCILLLNRTIGLFAFAIWFVLSVC